MPCRSAHVWGKSGGAETQAALHPPSSVPWGGGPLYPKELPAPNSHTTPELLLNEWTLDFRCSMRETLKDWGQEGKEGKIEGKRRRGWEETVGWHHWLSGHEFEQTLGDREGQGSLACCNAWDCRVGRDLVTKQQQRREAQFTWQK